MLDTLSSDPVSGHVEVVDYIELGRLVADWTVCETTRPGGVEELARQLDGIARIPLGITAVEFVQGKENVLVIRLPDKGRMEQRMQELESPLVGDHYRLPKFYDDIYHRHFGPEMAPLDVFLARMGDHTIAQCR